MVARRAHNPEVVRFKSHLRNQKENHPTGWFFFLLAAFGGWDLSLTAFGTKARPPPLAAECRANNLQPKRKGLSILFATVDGTKQGVCRAECTRSVEATADDYATAAEGREVNGQSRMPVPTNYSLHA